MLGLKMSPRLSRRGESLHRNLWRSRRESRAEKKHRALRSWDIAHQDVVECGLRFDFYRHSLPA